MLSVLFHLLTALAVVPLLRNHAHTRIGIAIGPRLVTALKPGAINFGYEEEDWHRTCVPCYGNNGLWSSHLLHLACSKNGSTNLRHFDTFTNVDLDLCVTNYDGQVNNRDDNDSDEHGNHKNLNFSNSCFCTLQWQFINGSISCYCNKFNEKNDAMLSYLPFKGVLFNENGRAGCFFGSKKVYGTPLNECPKVNFTNPPEP